MNLGCNVDYTSGHRSLKFRSPGIPTKRCAFPGNRAQPSLKAPRSWDVTPARADQQDAKIEWFLITIEMLTFGSA